MRSYAPQGPVEIFLHEGLIADAIAVVNEGATHSLVELVADAAISSHPDWVIQASRQQAEPIMDEGKAQYYHAAARWLGKVRAAYRATGTPAGVAVLPRRSCSRGTSGSTSWCRS